MSLTLVIIDARVPCLGAGSSPRTLLLLPVGWTTVLDHLVASLGSLSEKDILVYSPFAVDADYEADLNAATSQPVKAVDQSTLAAILRDQETSDYVLVVEARRYGLSRVDAAKVHEYLNEYRGAAYGIAVGSDPEATRELVEYDAHGQIKRVQRFYNLVNWPEVANRAVLHALVPARALASETFNSLSELRTALTCRGLLGRDVPIQTDALDLADEGGFLAFHENVLPQYLRPPVPEGFMKIAPGVLAAVECQIHSSARLVGPIVVQPGAAIEEDATVVGPVVLGARSRIGRGATVAQSVVVSQAVVPESGLVRHRVVSGMDLPAASGADPQVQFSFSPPEPILPRVLPGAGDGEVPSGWSLGVRWHHLAKRMLDVTVSAISLVMLSPLFAAVALLIRLESHGPVFFSHRRERRGGSEFMCLKFRTMVADAHRRQRELYQKNEVDGPQFKIRDDPRVTRLGHWLRATNIDELPQLINVLCGHMSLVGPRPSPFRENQICVPWRRARLSVRPGITGLWQICRDDDRSRGDFHEWIFYDITYVRNFSFWLDMKILLATVATFGGRWRIPLSWMVRRGHRHTSPLRDTAAA